MITWLFSRYENVQRQIWECVADSNTVQDRGLWPGARCTSDSRWRLSWQIRRIPGWLSPSKLKKWEIFVWLRRLNSFVAWMNRHWLFFPKAFYGTYLWLTPEQRKDYIDEAKYRRPWVDVRPPAFLSLGHNIIIFWDGDWLIYRMDHGN